MLLLILSKDAPLDLNFLVLYSRPQAIIRLGGVVVSYIAFQKVANYIRELNFSIPRKKLVNDYKEKYGEKFLIDVLDPNFRLPDSA